MPRKLDLVSGIKTLASYSPAFLSAFLLILCFPKADLGWLVWVALIPLFRFLLQPGTLKRAIYAGYFTGVIFYAGLLYWIFITCRVGGVSAPFSFLAWVGLS